MYRNLLVATYFSFIAYFLPQVHSFQVELDKNKMFEQAVKSSVTVNTYVPRFSNITKPSSIIVFDDVTHSPFTPELESIISFIRGRKNKELLPKKKTFVPRKLLKTDENPTEYWFDNRIHSFGNVGFLGAVHASAAPVATKLIDAKAYNNIDVRKLVSEELYEVVKKSKARLLDMCCGVGMSTRALGSAFDDAEAIVGIDTSPEMIGVAKGLTRVKKSFDFIEKRLLNNPNKFLSSGVKTKYARGNAEETIFPDKSFDLVTIMYAFHEIPRLGRFKILREARRVLQDKGTLAIVDICREYKPSSAMLMGEPYVVEYQKNIHKQIWKMSGFSNLRYKVIIPGHVCMWLLEKR